MADPNYKPPKIPKPPAARARIYEGIAKNELLSQCARPPFAASASCPVELVEGSGSQQSRSPRPRVRASQPHRRSEGGDR